MKIILIAALLLSAVPGIAEQAESTPYAEEVDLLEARLAEDGFEAATLYNLGNALYRLGDYGPAILAYERALLLDPRAPDIRANLALARDAAAAFDEMQPPVWEAPLFWLGFNEWLIVGAGALIVLAVVSLVEGFGFPSRKQQVLRIVTIVGIIVLFASLAAISLRYSELNRAIVLKQGASVRLSPFPTAEVVATLNAGKPVHVEREHENFFLVENGWISKEDAERVFPSAHAD